MENCNNLEVNLEVNLEKITHIVHISDIHIRLTKRHDEYREVFDQLYAEIKQTPETTLIINTGDTLHSKTDLSPECVSLASELLKKLADIRPLVMILGNHDLNLSNSNRLDSLSPIVTALNHHNIFYLKNSGLYKIKNVLFNVYSVLEEPENYLKNSDIPSRYTDNIDCLINLYHGSVDGIKTNTGYTIKNPRMPLDKFDGADITMLGDIHIYKTLQEYDKFNKKPVIAYASSIISQDHSETDKYHGYILWNVIDKTHEYKILDNPYGFFTVEIVDGNLVTDMSSCPKNPKLRVKHTNTGLTEVKERVSELKNKYQLSELSYVRCDATAIDNVNSESNNKLDDWNISDINAQNTLILEYLLKRGEFLTEEQKDNLFTLNRNINAELGKEDYIRHIRYKLKKLEFDNCFCYGEGNVVDFSKLKDIIGLFSKNASGKSSLVEVLCFALFDKTSKAFKASKIINTEKNYLFCKVTFEINGIDHVIERRGVKDKKGNIKVDVNFYKIENEKVIELNDEARRGTNAVIRDYIGSFEDFCLTSVALQGKDTAFIDLGQTEKKDLFNRFMGINIFDSLHEIAVDKFKQTNAILKNLQKEDFTTDLANIQKKLEIIKSQFQDCKSEYDNKIISLEQCGTLIVDNTSKLIKTHATSENLNIKKLTATKENLENERNTFISKELKIKSELSEMIQLATNLNAKFEQLYANRDVESLYKQYNEKFIEHKDMLHTFELKKMYISEQFKKLQHLSEHKYDPNCAYCMNNVFVKDAIKTKQELEAEKVTINHLKDGIALLNDELTSFGTIEVDYKEYKLLENEKNLLKDKAIRLKKSQMDVENKILKINQEYSGILHAIELYETNKENIHNNSLISTKIEEIKKVKLALTEKTRELNKQLLKLNGDISKLEHQETDIKTNIEIARKMEDDIIIYNYYISAISRDGLPYDLISESLPRIENEVNNILSQIVEFSMRIRTDGSNILTNIVYDDKEWPLELCSGMEKFCSALAMRVALTTVSSIPKSDFLIIDEGVSVLDAEHMSMIHSLFTFLKTNYTFIMVISHLDLMRDIVNSHLEIQCSGEYSKINN